MTKASPEVRASAVDRLATRLAIEAVQLVGGRRAHELIEEAVWAGAGADFQ